MSSQVAFQAAPRTLVAKSSTAIRALVADEPRLAPLVSEVAIDFVNSHAAALYTIAMQTRLAAAVGA